ncbi:MAG TPA: Sapep family Mn(2+)-dependent dipeptidase [Bacillota bacterium]|nr:Sapep family Mn(2+)-dependent dipeptidase [Bacillota bacterium]
MCGNKLIAEVENRRAEIIDALCRFIRIESISNHDEKVREALDFVLDMGRSLGFNAEARLNGQVGVIEIGQGDETLGILSHVDVVGPGNLGKWTTKPFEPVIKDGRIYGRGALDDKGATIASLFAMKAVCDQGTPLKKKVQMILGTREEVEWTDMTAYVKEFPLPDYGFTPDGEFPLCNIEKGCIDIVMSFPLDDCAGDGRYLSLIDSGTAPNIVPGVCTAEITEIRNGKTTVQPIEVLGRSVHSCAPEKGENAIFKLAEKVKEIDLKKNKLLELLCMVSERFGDMYGGSVGLRSESEYYNGEFVHRNVLSPTLFKVEDRCARINVNIRSAYGAKEEEIVGAMKALALSYGGEVVKVTILPAVYVSKDRPFVRAMAEAYEEATGLKNEFVLAYGGSYAKAMPNIVSWGPIFPGEEDTCHEENEYISIESLMDNAKIFSVAIGKIALSGVSFR